VAEQLNVDAGLVKACGQPTDGLISKNNSLCIRKATQLLPLYNPLVIKALHILSGIFSYPHLYFADPRGLLHGITQGDMWAEMNYAESRADTVRGGHYHRKTLEGFYMVRGRVKVQYRPLKAGPEYCFIAERGDSFLVPLLTVHTFTVLEDSAWINYLSRAMDDEDKDIHRD
jgi:dTDP-4-dehydrorhamnose 3,5-epimerase-like enzyme